MPSSLQDTGDRLSVYFALKAKLITVCPQEAYCADAFFFLNSCTYKYVNYSCAKFTKEIFVSAMKA